MTTGRINQVTILNPEAPPKSCTREAPAKGRNFVTRNGEHRSEPGQAGCLRERKQHRLTIQLPPLSSPKDGPRQSIRVDNHRTRPHAPLRRRFTTAKSRREADTGGDVPPKGVVKQWLLTNHPQTPKICLLTRGPTGLQSPAASRDRCYPTPHKRRGSPRPR